MKKALFAVLFCFAVLASGAQKLINDDMVQVRQVPTFHSIRVGGGIDLYLSMGDEAVAVSARTEEYRSRIRTTVENGVLRIWYDWKEMGFVVNGNKALRAYVSVKTLSQLSGSGGSDIFVEGELRSASLKLDVSGGSDFRGKVAVDQLDATASGGSDINVSGTAGSLKVRASGGSDFRGFELTADACTADASGGSDVHVSVNREIKAHASGGSDVHYRGNPTVVESHKSGGSDIRKRG